MIMTNKKQNITFPAYRLCAVLLLFCLLLIKYVNVEAAQKSSGIRDSEISASTPINQKSISELLNEDEKAKRPCSQYSLTKIGDDPKNVTRIYELRDVNGNSIVINGWSMDLYACIDIDNDGIMEAVVHNFTEGWHCCNSFSLYKKVGDKLILVGYFGRENTNRAAFIDLNGDGKKEIVTFDIVNYIEGLCYACSPDLPLIYCYKNNKLEECTNDFPQLIRREIKENLGKRDNYLKGNPPGPEDPYIKGFALEYLSLFEMLGKETEGWKGVKRWYPQAYKWLKDYYK